MAEGWVVDEGMARAMLRVSRLLADGLRRITVEIAPAAVCSSHTQRRERTSLREERRCEDPPACVHL
jgi:hypothetical protein